MDDTYTVRLGSEYLVFLDRTICSIRCGMGYDPAPGVGDVDDIYTVSVGAGIQLLNRINLDLAYEFRWGNDVNQDILRGLDATQDIRHHRFLASTIYYF